MDQFLVGAALNDLAVPDDEDLIRGEDGGQAVGDQDGGPLFDQGIDGGLDGGLGDRVKGRGGFVIKS